jgi:hypothetical protein
MAELGFAAALASAGSPGQLLGLEYSAGQSGRFADLDSLAANLASAFHEVWVVAAC